MAIVYKLHNALWLDGIERDVENRSFLESESILSDHGPVIGIECHSFFDFFGIRLEPGAQPGYKPFGTYVLHHLHHLVDQRAASTKYTVK